MTAYRPLVSDNNIRIKECTSAEYDNMLGQIAYFYSQNPSVVLSIVGSNGNISPLMYDDYYRGSATVTGTGNQTPANDGAAEYPASTDAQFRDNWASYDKVSQTVTDPGGHTSYYNWRYKPVRVDNSGVTEMTFQDIMDTFIDPVVDRMVDGTYNGSIAAGSYYISTLASVSGSTKLGTVFVDRYADLSTYASKSGGLGGSSLTGVGVRNEYNIEDTYSLYSVDGVDQGPAGAGFRSPLIIDYTSNGHNNPTGLRHMTDTEFTTLFTDLIRQAIYNRSGYTLRYNLEVTGSGSGTTQGTVIEQQVIDPGTFSSARKTQYISLDDYRAAEFPAGTIHTGESWELKLERT